jgi:hypothetical protein
MADPQTQIAAQAVQIDELTQKVDALTTKVDQLLAIFNGAKGALTLIKWLGGFAVFIGGMWSLVQAIVSTFHGK